MLTPPDQLLVPEIFFPFCDESYLLHPFYALVAEFARSNQPDRPAAGTRERFAVPLERKHQFLTERKCGAVLILALNVHVLHALVGSSHFDYRVHVHACPFVSEVTPAINAMMVEFFRDMRQLNELVIGERQRLPDVTGGLEMPISGSESRAVHGVYGPFFDGGKSPSWGYPWLVVRIASLGHKISIECKPFIAFGGRCSCPNVFCHMEVGFFRAYIGSFKSDPRQFHQNSGAKQLP